MRIDLLPASSRPEPKLKFTRLLLLLAIAIFTIGGLLFAWVEFSDYQASVKEYEQMVNLYMSLQPELTLAKRHETEKGELNQRQMEILQLFDLYQNQTRVFKNIAVALPTTDIWISRISAKSQGQIILEGGSASFAIVGNFLKNVNSRNFFQSSSITEIRQLSVEAFSYYSFIIEMNTGRSSLEYAEN